jgi:CubicO group peptidase (beta-lactamase class C family)
LIPIVVVAVLALVASAPDPQAPDSITERRNAVESGLLPPVVVDGETGFDIRERMLEHGVPGLSVAVISDGRVEWASGYGVKRKGDPDSVVASTLFQAASISKPLTAATVLRLVDEGRLDLDRDVSDYLRSWLLPKGEQTAEHPVTLRRLLTHTAGVDVHSFGGLSRGSELPTAADMLAGIGGMEAVHITATPGERFDYSSGGYQIVQVVLEDVTGESFPALVDRLVFAPLEMDRSTFEQPLPGALVPEAAAGHARNDTIRGGWQEQPARAGGGLWTSASDLALFAIGIRDAWLGEPGAILERETAREMLTEQVAQWGLGLALSGAGENLSFGHAGDNRGYSALLVFYPVSGDGVVVMANGAFSRPLLLEVVRAVARVYDWPDDYAPEVRTRLTTRARRALPLLGALTLLGLCVWWWRRPRA